MRLTDQLGDPDDPTVRRRWRREQPGDGSMTKPKHPPLRVWIAAIACVLLVGGGLAYLIGGAK